MIISNQISMSMCLRFFAILLLTISISLYAAVPTYDGEKLDLANHNIASLFKRGANGHYQLIHGELDNQAAFELYAEPGDYKIELPVLLTSFPNENVWLQIRGAQTYHTVTVNNDVITTKYAPLNRILLPEESLEVGENLIAIHFSVTETEGGDTFRDILLAHFAQIYQESNQYALASLSFAVLFVMLCLMSFSFYIYFQRHPILLFSGLFYLFSAAAAFPLALFWLEELPFFVYGELLTFISYLIGLSYLALNMGFVEHQHDKKRTLVVAATLIALILPFPTFFIFSLCTLLSVLYLTNGKSAQSHFFVMLLIPVVSAIDGFNVLDGVIDEIDSTTAKSFLFQLDYFALSLLSLYLMVFFFSQWRNKWAHHHTLSLQKKNLELQLIDKHIQPHFLMNAMMSIQQQIESNPDDAVEMIDVLSEAFQVLHRQIGKELVSLNEELAMCGQWIEFVSKTQQAQYELKVSANVADVALPPGLVYTFIENGIKHGYRGDANGVFSVTVRLEGDRLVLSVENNGLRDSHSSLGSGLGLRFVKERLEIWQPGKWNLESGPSELGWKNLICIEGFSKGTSR